MGDISAIHCIIKWDTHTGSLWHLNINLPHVTTFVVIYDDAPKTNWGFEEWLFNWIWQLQALWSDILIYHRLDSIKTAWASRCNLWLKLTGERNFIKEEPFCQRVSPPLWVLQGGILFGILYFFPFPKSCSSSSSRPISMLMHMKKPGQFISLFFINCDFFDNGVIFQSWPTSNHYHFSTALKKQVNVLYNSAMMTFAFVLQIWANPSGLHLCYKSLWHWK